MRSDDLLSCTELRVADLAAAPSLHQLDDGWLGLEAFGSQRAKSVGYRLLLTGHDSDSTPANIWPSQKYRLRAGTVTRTNYDFF